jgi:hypothetical protein
MGLVDLYNATNPVTGKINNRGGDKTPIDGDGGLDLSKNEALMKKARGGSIGQGTPKGYHSGTTYSSTPKE